MLTCGNKGRRQPSRLVLRDAVFETLRRAIVRGTLRSGLPLREEELARELGVSRTPVREALQRLLALSLVQRDSAHTLVVKRFMAKDIKDLYYVRTQLETGAAKLAALHGDRDTVETLERLVEAMAAAVRRGNAVAYQKYHRRFHMQIAKSSGNAFLAESIQALLDTADTIWASTRPTMARYSRADATHRDILSAIASRRASAAANAMTRHLARSLALILQEVRRESPQASSLGQMMGEIAPRGKGRRDGQGAG